MTQDQILEIIENYKLRIPPTVFYDLKADIVNFEEPTTKNDLPKYCDRNICLKNEYNNIGCDDCEVTKSQESTTKNDLSSGLEKNSNKLEKNFGELDCISREQALEPYKILENTDTLSVYTIRQNLAELPSMGRYDSYTDKFIKE